jgi:DnaJ-class molecular chaperone
MPTGDFYPTTGETYGASRAHAEICPVCNGSGRLPESGTSTAGKTCHGCNGTGWVTVQDTVPPYVQVEPVMYGPVRRP